MSDLEEKRLNPREKALLEEKKKNDKMRNRYILVGVIVFLFSALVVYTNYFFTSSTALRVGDTRCSLADANYEYNNAYGQIAQTYVQYGLIDNSIGTSVIARYDGILFCCLLGPRVFLAVGS